MTAVSTEVEEPFLTHTCNPKAPGKPLPWGKKAPEGECGRCDQLRAGAEPRKAHPAIRAAAAKRAGEQTNGYPADSEREAHFAPGGPHQTGQCNPICTFGDY